MNKKKQVKHGHSRRGRVSSEYMAWRAMRQRCQNPNNDRYHRYGSRGIKVCERWQSFQNFLTDMGEKPSTDLTLERMDNDGNYEPGNCKWATQKEQAGNRQASPKQYPFVGLGPNGEKVLSNNQSEFARCYGLDNADISHCLTGRLETHKGWRFERCQ